MRAGRVKGETMESESPCTVRIGDIENESEMPDLLDCRLRIYFAADPASVNLQPPGDLQIPCLTIMKSILSTVDLTHKF
jgi:hypothetical protein